MNEENFRYQVMSHDGTKQEINVSARSEDEAVMKIQRIGLIPLKNLRSNAKESKKLFHFPERQKFDVTAFINRLSPLLSANVPLEKALSVMEDGARNPETGKMIRGFREQLHEGISFSALMQKNEHLFPPIVTGLVKTGEEAGCLAAVMNDLRKFLQEQRDFRNFIVTSSIYPIIVAVVTLGVVLLLFTVFIPQFATVFEDMHAELPALTRYMLSISRFLTGNWYLFPLLVILCIVLHRKMNNPGLLHDWRDAMLLKIPVVNSLIISVQMSSFLQAMAIMMRSHVHLLLAMKISFRLITNSEIRKSFENAMPKIQGGEKLSDVLGEIRYLPDGTAAMLKVAEESGEIGEMFTRLFQEEQDETRLKFKRLLAMLEPLIIMILSVMVMIVVLAVFLAVWKMNSIR